MHPGTVAARSPDPAAVVVAATGETTTSAELEAGGLRTTYDAAPTPGGQP